MILYHAIALWVPTLGGTIGFVRLRKVVAVGPAGIGRAPAPETPTAPPGEDPDDAAPTRHTGNGSPDPRRRAAAHPRTPGSTAPRRVATPRPGRCARIARNLGRPVANAASCCFSPPNEQWSSRDRQPWQVSPSRVARTSSREVGVQRPASTRPMAVSRRGRGCAELRASRRVSRMPAHESDEIRLKSRSLSRQRGIWRIASVCGRLLCVSCPEARAL